MSSEEVIEANSLEAVVLHLKYLRTDLRVVGTKVSELSGQMATRTELESVRRELHSKLDELRQEMHAGSASSAFERMLTIVTKIGAAIAVLMAVAGGAVALVHLIDRVPK